MYCKERDVQERLIEVSSELRARASALAATALDAARSRAGLTSRRVEVLKGSFDALTIAGRELNKVARRHASRFVKENSALAIAAGRDMSALAQSTYATLSGRKVAAKARKPAVTRKPRVTRKRTVSTAA